MTLFHSLYTVVLFIVFISIVIWAYSRKRKRDFDEAARLPFSDEADNRNDKGDRA
ncbi:MAG: cbb3-type cytochrome c oxidase subunit 3 [Gammaproteobacteria bacterium]